MTGFLPPQWLLSNQQDPIKIKIPEYSMYAGIERNERKIDDDGSCGSDSDRELDMDKMYELEDLMVPEEDRNDIIYDDFCLWKDIGRYNKQPRVVEPTDKNHKFLEITQAFDKEITDLYEFDWEKDVKDNATLVLIGRRGSGKSFLMDNGFYYLRHRIRRGVCISGTTSNGFWQNRIPKEQVHDVSLMDTVLERVIENQQKLLKNDLYKKIGIDPRFFVILDDVMHMVETVRYSKYLRALFTNGRHLKILTIVLVQDPRGIPPILKECTDVCIIFKIATGPRREIAVNDFVDVFSNRKYADRFLEMNTGKVMPDGSMYDEEKYPSRESRNITVPKALVCIKNDLSRNVYSLFKMIIGQKTDDFVLGDRDYWYALIDGNVGPLLQ